MWPSRIVGPVLLVASVATPSLPAQKPTMISRSIIRKGIDRDGKVHGEFAKTTGLANATSVGYKILLLDADGKEQPVDPGSYQFQLGQQFRLEVECDSDLYLYVFHESPQGVRTLLVPDAADAGPPMIKKGQKKVVPDDGTYFEFVPPAGKEQLLMYAAPKPRPQLTPEEAFKDQKQLDPKKRIELKSAQDKIFDPAKKLRARSAFRYTDPNEKSTTEVVGSKDQKQRPDLFVQIQLNTQ
jgi:hypothetical protein